MQRDVRSRVAPRAMRHRRYVSGGFDRESSQGGAAASSPSSRSSSSASSSSTSSSSSSSSSGSDAESYANFQRGELLGAGRFAVVDTVGQGTFSRVLRVRRVGVDSEASKTGGTGGGAARVRSGPRLGEELAVKVFRGAPRYDAAARDEWDMLRALSAVMTPSDGFLPPELGFRTREKYSCIVFPLAGPSVLQVLEANRAASRSGFPPFLVRSIAAQLLHFLARLHGCGVVHTDIKPENVVFISRQRAGAFPLHTAVGIIDMSNAVFRAQDLSPEAQAQLPPPKEFPRRHHRGPRVIQTRHYRAPEVVFGAPWGFAADMWSVGCLLAELASGRCLFMTHDNREHLALMTRVLGPLSAATAAAAGFTRGSAFDDVALVVDDVVHAKWPPRTASQSDIDFVRNHPTLEQRCEGHALLADLCRALLRYDPSQRLTAAQALSHPYFLQAV